MDATRQAIYGCIQTSFSGAGLNQITSIDQTIAWQAIAKDVKREIGISMRSCIKEKTQQDPGDLVVAILVASTQEPAMSVSDLIEIVYQLMQP
jgi:hypothetical protein